MIFWLLCAALTAGVVLVLTRPLGDPGRAQSAAHDADLDVYRDQLREVDADVARGLVSPAEAEAARIEIRRRILARADAAAAEPGFKAAAWSQNASLAIAAVIPLLAIAMYVSLGSPGLPGRPAAQRIAAGPSDLSPIMELVERVEARLREAPQDGQGWDVIAPVYLRLERFQDAVGAYQRAIALQGESARRLAGLAEAQVMANNGVVVEDARKAFARLLALEPNRLEARFWLAIAKEQDGDTAAAVADYGSLLAEAPADAPWRQMVEERLALLQGRRPAPPVASGVQLEQIEGMVAGLAARLKADGSDVAGWRRLLQSYTVLGRKDAATAALADARKALAGNASALAEVESFAGGLGLTASGAGGEAGSGKKQ